MPFSKYLPEHMGAIKLVTPGPFIAGSYAELVLVYTAGTFGIDDTGMVKISWRTTSDLSKPQFNKPDAPNFATVEASNGAKLDVWFDRLNIRPYANTVLIRVGRGYLRAGDTLTIRLGDRRQGSPGLRLQTNVEKNVLLQTSIDAFATYEFCLLPEQPTFDLVPGPAVRWKAICALACGCRRAIPARHRRRGHVGQSDRGCGRHFAACILAAAARAARQHRHQERRRPAGDRKPCGCRHRRHRAHGEGRRPASGARQSAAGRQRRAAAALLGRSARPERRDHRDGNGGRLFPLRPRQSLCRHGRPPGQRFPDHRRILARVERAYCAIR